MLSRVLAKGWILQSGGVAPDMENYNILHEHGLWATKSYPTKARQLPYELDFFVLKLLNKSLNNCEN